MQTTEVTTINKFTDTLIKWYVNIGILVNLNGLAVDLWTVCNGFKEPSNVLLWYIAPVIWLPISMIAIPFAIYKRKRGAAALGTVYVLYAFWSIAGFFIQNAYDPEAHAQRRHNKTVNQLTTDIDILFSVAFIIGSVVVATSAPKPRKQVSSDEQLVVFHIDDEH